MKKSFLFGGFCLLLVACDESDADRYKRETKEREARRPQWEREEKEEALNSRTVQRYQISHSGSLWVKLDTATGNSWVLRGGVWNSLPGGTTSFANEPAQSSFNAGDTPVDFEPLDLIPVSTNSHTKAEKFLDSAKKGKP